MMMQETTTDMLNKLFELGGTFVRMLNAVISVGSEVIVFRYYRAVWDLIAPLDTVLSSARTLAIVFVFAGLWIVFSNLISVGDAYHRDIKIKPSFSEASVDSAATQSSTYTFWLFLCVGAVWVAAHVLADLVMPIDTVKDIYINRP